MLQGELEIIIEREDCCEREGVSEQEPGAVEEIPCTHTFSTLHVDSGSWIQDSFTCDPSVNNGTHLMHSIIQDV